MKELNNCQLRSIDGEVDVGFFVPFLCFLKPRKEPTLAEATTYRAEILGPVGVSEI